MNKHFSILILLISFTPVSGFSLPAKNINQAESIIPSIINNDFTTALLSIDSIITIDPDDPFPYILKLTALGMRDIDFDCTIDSTQFLSTYQKAITSSTSLESSLGKSSYSRMMVGLSKIMYASFYLRNKAYISAMKNGFDALDILDEAYRIDSTNTEVLMFLGLYDFARSELKNRLWWILFWYPGDRKVGIERLRQCSLQSTLLRTAAQLSLSEIYIKEGNLKSADSLLKELEKYYPQSRFVLWSRVKFYEAQKKYSEAAKTYTQLSDSYQKTNEGRYNYLVSRYKAAQMFRNSGEIATVISLCQSLLKEPDFNKYKDLFKDTQRLLERVQNAESKS